MKNVAQDPRDGQMRTSVTPGQVSYVNSDHMVPSWTEFGQTDPTGPNPHKSVQTSCHSGAGAANALWAWI